MRYLTEINLAFGNLYTHKLRTFLTMLGMIFGVGADRHAFDRRGR